MSLFPPPTLIPTQPDGFSMVVKTLMLQLLHLQYFFWSTHQYVLSTIINVPFVLLKKEIIFPLLPNNIYFHHHYLFPLCSTLSIFWTAPSIFPFLPINIHFDLFSFFPPSEFLGQYHQYFPCSTIYIQCNNFPIPLSLSATISWLMNCDCVFSRSSCKYFCIISHKTLRNHALDSHTRLHYVFNCFRK